MKVYDNKFSNADETHLLFNMYNECRLGITGGIEVNYADLLSGGRGMTILIRLQGGRDAQISAFFNFL